MPQRSYPYAVTRVRAMEARMLDEARFARLKEADEGEALKLLSEWNYGRGEDVEARIAAQLAEVRKTVWEITPDPETTSLFLLGIDAHNLKALYKARLLGIDPQGQDVLLTGGLFDVEKLEKSVQDRDFKDLPEVLKTALEGVEKSIAIQPDPRTLSAMIDKAVFAYIDAALKKHGNAFAQSYFSAQRDFINVRSVIRARLLKWDAHKLEPMLIPGGGVPHKALVEALDLPLDALPKKLSAGAERNAISAALEGYVKEPDSVALDRHFDAALMEKLRKGKGDSFSLSPIIGYLVGREAEAKALRVVFASKRAGADAVLPALYA